jgi:hypothetical protein
VRSSSFVAIVLGLSLAGCTGHASAPKPDVLHEDEPEVEVAPPASPDPEPPPTPEPEPEPEPDRPLADGPFTPLRHKPFAAVLGELNGDPWVDILALVHAHERAGLVLLSGSSYNFHENEPQAVDASGLALGDFDNDGDLDALLLDARGPPAYSLARNDGSDGSGRFSIGRARRIPGRFGGELRGASIADLDADGDLDAIVPLWDELRILLGDGTGEFKPGARLSSGRDPFATALADLDGDGHLDLAATSGAAPATDPDHYDSAGASVWIYRGSAEGFAEPVRIEISGAHEVEPADLDGDGSIELVVSGSGGLTVIRDPLGEPQATRTLVATDGPLLIADVLDPVGPDLITSSYTQGRVHVLTGYPKLDKTSIEAKAGAYVIGLFAPSITGVRPDLVLLDAGPPDPLGPAIEVLFSFAPAE